MVEQPNANKIILQGKEEELKPVITSVLAQLSIMSRYDLGYFVGYPVPEYVRVTNQDLKLMVRFESNKTPPWRANALDYSPHPTYSIPNVDKTKVNWQIIKQLMGGKNGYHWGPWRANALFESKARMYVFGRSQKEAESMLKTLASLSLEPIKHLSVSEWKYPSGSPSKFPRQVYPAFFTIINNGYDRSKVRNNKPPNPKVVRIPLYLDDPPEGVEAQIAEALSRKFTYK